MFAILLPRGADHHLMGALQLQRKAEFRVYVPEGDSSAVEYEGRLTVVKGSLADVAEPWTVVMETGALPGRDFLRRARRCIEAHKGYDVFHVNTEGDKKYRLSTTVSKLFKDVMRGERTAPLAAFVIRTEVLRKNLVEEAPGVVLPFATILACAGGKGIRTIRWERLSWKAPAPALGPDAQEREIRSALSLLHWSEGFFTEEYPLSTGETLELIAKTLARLYPSYPKDDLKEMFREFRTADGALRRVRAANALSSAIKEREKELQ